MLLHKTVGLLTFPLLENFEDTTSEIIRRGCTYDSVVNIRPRQKKYLEFYSFTHKQRISCF